MYTPKHFQITDTQAMLDAAEKWNFGLIITSKNDNIETTLLPFIIDRKRNRLQGHFARANPHWKSLTDAAEALVSFQGPHCYISPSWYQARDLVPTWNYLSIQIKGPVTIIEDEDQCRTLIQNLVKTHESEFESPWTADQVKSDKLSAMMKAIVCFEIAIEAITGKEKLNQNRSKEDQQGVIDALSESSSTDQLMIKQLMKKNQNTDGV